MKRLAGGLLVLAVVAGVVGAAGDSRARAGACSPCFSGDALTGVAVAPDRRIIAVGGHFESSGSDGLLVRRYLPDGTLDPSFAGGAGQENLPVPGIFYGLGLDIRVSDVGSDGRFVVWDGNHMVAFLADGRLDSSFGIGGVVTVPSSEFGVVRLADGRVIVASPNTGIRRLEADGGIDTGYGSRGVQTPPR